MDRREDKFLGKTMSKKSLLSIKEWFFIMRKISYKNCGFGYCIVK